MSEEVSELRARYDRLNLLYQIGKVIHSTLKTQEALLLVVNEAVRVTRASSGSVYLLNPINGLLEMQTSKGLPAKAADLKLRLGEGLAGWVVRTGKPARVGDVSRDARSFRFRPRVGSVLCVPLEITGEVRGALSVASKRREAFSAEDEELLTALAVQAARAIQNTWQYEQLQLKARLFESLASVSRTINSTLNLAEVFNAVTREAWALMEAKLCSLMMLDENRQWLDLRASYGAGKAYISKPRLSVEESLLGVVVRRKKPLQTENVQTSSRYQNVEVARREGLVSLLSVPLLFDGQAIGTLSVYMGHPHRFSNEEIRILSALAELSATAIEKARLYERIVDIEEQLRQNEKLSALGMLATEVAHEIRNPLTVMRMLYHSLNLEFPAGDPRATDARILGQKMEHLNRVVEQILDFARTTEPKLVPVDLNELIKELLLLVRHKLANQSVQLVRRLQPDLPPVMGDTAMLEQAFLNLVLNAVEAMPRGGTLTIRTCAVPAARGGTGSLQVAVDIQDSGHGMSGAQRQGVFSAVLNTTKAKGTGLGLVITRRTVEAHGGTIKIKSRLGKGTIVTMTLPQQARLNASCFHE